MVACNAVTHAGLLCSLLRSIAGVVVTMPVLTLPRLIDVTGCGHAHNGWAKGFAEFVEWKCYELAPGRVGAGWQGGFAYEAGFCKRDFGWMVL